MELEDNPVDNYSGLCDASETKYDEIEERTITPNLNNRNAIKLGYNIKSSIVTKR